VVGARCLNPWGALGARFSPCEDGCGREGGERWGGWGGGGEQKGGKCRRWRGGGPLGLTSSALLLVEGGGGGAADKRLQAVAKSCCCSEAAGSRDTGRVAITRFTTHGQQARALAETGGTQCRQESTRTDYCVGEPQGRAADRAAAAADA